MCAAGELPLPAVTCPSLAHACAPAVRRLSAVQQQRAVMSAAAGSTGVSLVFVTVPSADVGRKIAHSLVENKLAACVNIIPGLESIYSWKGKIESDQELLLKVRCRVACRQCCWLSARLAHGWMQSRGW